MISVLACSSASLANLNPVGRFVGCTFEALIDKSFKQTNGVIISSNPIVVNLFCNFSKDMACQIVNIDPWQDKESGVVCYENQILSSYRSIPSDKLIPRSDFPCSSGEKQTCQRSLTSVNNQIPQSLSRTSLVPDIVISVKKAFEKITIKGIFTDVDNLKRNQLVKFIVDWIGRMQNVRNSTISQMVVRGTNRRWQYNMAMSFQF